MLKVGKKFEITRTIWKTEYFFNLLLEVSTDQIPYNN